MALPNPHRSADANYQNSILMNSHLLSSLRGNDTFRSATHISVTKEVRAELKIRRSKDNESVLGHLTKPMTPAMRRTIMRGTETGQWLSSLPTTVNGTQLSAQEFRDALFLRYAIPPPDLPSVVLAVARNLTSIRFGNKYLYILPVSGKNSTDPVENPVELHLL